MRGARLVLRAEARGRWRVWLGVALVLGLAAGTVLMFVSGARRTASAYDRFLAGARPSDVLVQDSADFGGATVDLEALRNLPQLDDATIATGYYRVCRDWTATGSLRLGPSSRCQIPPAASGATSIAGSCCRVDGPKGSRRWYSASTWPVGGEWRSATQLSSGTSVPTPHRGTSRGSCRGSPTA